jgi:hypothetical protein
VPASDDARVSEVVAFGKEASGQPSQRGASRISVSSADEAPARECSAASRPQMAAQAAHSHKVATGSSTAVNLLSGKLAVIERIIPGRIVACHSSIKERLSPRGNVDQARKRSQASVVNPSLPKQQTLADGSAHGLAAAAASARNAPPAGALLYRRRVSVRPPLARRVGLSGDKNILTAEKIWLAGGREVIVCAAVRRGEARGGFNFNFDLSTRQF